MDRSARRARPPWWAIGLFGGLAAAVSACVLLGHQAPETWLSSLVPGRASKSEFDGAMGIVGAATGLGVLGWGMVRRFARGPGPILTRLLQVAVSVAVLTAGFDYLYAKRTIYRPWAHTYDSFHYLLGPKYYAEHGYTQLYACTVQATTRAEIPDATEVRDLETYAMTTAGALRAGDDCSTRMGAARWAEFQADVQAYLRPEIAGPRRLRKFMRDQGYNGTPLQALVAGTVAELAGAVDYASLHRLALIDVAGVCAMMVAVTLAFGWRVGLVFAVFFFTNVVDRFGYTGGSFVRLSWLVMLGVGLAALRGRRWALAGACLTASALLNVFPILFVGGAAFSLLARARRQRRLGRAARRFLIAVAVTGALGACAGMAHARGPANYELFAEDMRVHARGRAVESPDGAVEHLVKHPGFGVGLKFAFLYRGEHYASSKSVGAVQRSKQFREVEPIYWAVGGLLVGLALVVASRLDAVEAAVLVGITGFFSLLGTVAYYFTCTSFLVLMLHRRVRDPGGLLLLVALFAVSSLGHLYLWLEPRASAVLNNTVFSLLLLLYLILATSHLGQVRGVWRDAARLLAARAPSSPPSRASGHEFLAGGRS